jgi:hypothetical protein
LIIILSLCFLLLLQVEGRRPSPERQAGKEPTGDVYEEKCLLHIHVSKLLLYIPSATYLERARGRKQGCSSASRQLTRLPAQEKREEIKRKKRDGQKHMGSQGS